MGIIGCTSYHIVVETFLQSSSRQESVGSNVTLKEIARELGVSHQLVSFALNGRGRMTEETRSRIVETAQRLGYRKNGSAMAMKNGRFGCVALLLSTSNNLSGLPQGLWNGIHDELAAHDLHLTVAKLPDAILTDAGAVPKILREWMSDGLLIDYTYRIPQRMMELIRAYRLPAVWLNTQQRADCVYPDDFEAGCRAARHLMEFGHKRIAYLDLGHSFDDPDEHYSVSARYQGVSQTLQKAGLSPWWEDVCVPEAERVAFFTARLGTPERPSALVCYGEDFEAALFAASILGLQVPRDLSIMTFGEQERLATGLWLSKMAVPEVQVGRLGVQMLQRKIEAPEIEFPPEIVPFELRTGQTCALAPSTQK